MQVIELIAKAHTGKENAKLLNMSFNTVQTHLNSIYLKWMCILDPITANTVAKMVSIWMCRGLIGITTMIINISAG